MKTAFVTGGSGFLGLNLLEQLIAANWKILVFDLSPLPESFAGREKIVQVQGDITDPLACEHSLQAGTDAVFHIAGDINHWKLANERQTQINVVGTRNMVNAALKKKVGRFIYTSSISSYGFHSERITEKSISNAENCWINYFRTKRLAELEITAGVEKGLDAVIINPANIIGPNDFSGFSRLFPIIKDGKLPGAAPGSASFGHVREIAKAHVSAYDKGKKGHNYLLGGVDTSWVNFFKEIGDLLQRKTPNKPTPVFVLKAIGRVSLWLSYLTRKHPTLTPEFAALLSHDHICSSEKAKKELDYQVTPLQDMLIDCKNWMIKEGRF